LIAFIDVFKGMNDNDVDDDDEMSDGMFSLSLCNLMPM
jgi:hypothetical protein